MPLQMKRANFKREDNKSTEGDDVRSHHSSLVVHEEVEANAEDEINEVAFTVEVDNRTSTVSQGNFDRYLKRDSREHPQLF